MKRYATFAVLLLFLVTGAVWASSKLTISPSQMKDGETKTFTDDGRKVTVKRDGDTTHVTIEGANGTKTLTITNDGSDIHIDGFDGFDGGTRRKIVVGPDRPRVMIDGFEYGDLPHKKLLPHKAQTWFVCPKDKTMLRVPEEKAGETFKCPVDGTTMEKRKGRGFAFFFDDELFESHDL
jgi:hypothetical protein